MTVYGTPPRVRAQTAMRAAVRELSVYILCAVAGCLGGGREHPIAAAAEAAEVAAGGVLDDRVREHEARARLAEDLQL